MIAQIKGEYFLINGLQTNIEVKNFKCRCCGCVEVEEEMIKAVIKFQSELGKPIRISNCVRCKKHNAEIGGSSKSAHLPPAYAIDFDCPDLNIDEIAMTAIEIFTGFGIYYSKATKKVYYHADIRPVKTYWYNVDKYVYSNDIERVIDDFKLSVEIKTLKEKKA